MNGNQIFKSSSKSKLFIDCIYKSCKIEEVITSCEVFYTLLLQQGALYTTFQVNLTLDFIFLLLLNDLLVFSYTFQTVYFTTSYCGSWFWGLRYEQNGYTEKTHWRDTKEKVLHWWQSKPFDWGPSPSCQESLRWTIYQRRSFPNGAHSGTLPSHLFINFLLPWISYIQTLC